MVFASVLLAATLGAAAAPAQRTLAVQIESRLHHKNRKEASAGHLMEAVRKAATQAAPDVKLVEDDPAYAIVGELLKVGKQLKLSLELHQTQDGKLLAAAVASGEDAEQLDASVPKAVTELLAPLSAAPKPAPGGRLSLPAPPSRLDTVYLADGDLVRGTVEREKPDVVVKLVSGKERTIPAKDVKRIAKHGSDATPLDAVYLKDGGVLRGKIESDRGDVVIKLLSGRTRTVPADSIQLVDKASPRRP